jgi:hypothetical protein
MTDERIGYRIVSHSPSDGYLTVATHQPINPQIGMIETAAGAGLYLGTSKTFCLDYYTGLTDDDDVLLTYSYLLNDLLSGDPDATAGEVTVRKAKLIAIAPIDS